MLSILGWRPISQPLAYFNLLGLSQEHINVNLRQRNPDNLTNVDKVQKSFYFIIRDIPLVENGKKTEALLLSGNFITSLNVVNEVQVWLVCVCFSFFFSFRCLHVNELALKGSFKEPC